MLRRQFLAGSAALAIGFAAGGAAAQDAFKIGLILPMTGQQASTGKQIKAAVDLYMAQHGNTVAGKKVEVILKDDGAVPDNTKRLAQELIVNDKVNVIAGFGVTPAALAAAPLATEAKIPEIVMAAGTSIITERSPYIARTSFTLAQSSEIIADWAIKNGRARMRRSRSATNSRPPAARLRKRSRSRSPTPTSRRSCSALPTPSPTPSSSSFRPARAAPS
jgi:branched-chain amino acid transport system substrate-binding protein